MFISPVDHKIHDQDECWEMKQEYKRRFGKNFVPFTYADFQGTKDVPAAQIWKDKLAECLRENKPYDGTENWRTSEFYPGFRKRTESNDPK